MKSASLALALFASVLSACGPATGGASGDSTGSTGALLNLTTFGTSKSDDAHSIAVDHDGNIVIDLFTWQSIDLGTGPLNGNEIIAKLAPDGHVLWAKSFVTSPLSWMSIAVGPSNEIYATRYLPAGAYDFGGGTRHLAYAQGVLLKLDADGNYVWDALPHPSTSNFTAQSSIEHATVDSNGNVWLAATIGGGMTFAGKTFPSDGFSGLLKLSSDGHIEAMQSIKGQCEIQSIAVSDSNDVAAVGRFTGTLDYGSGTIGALGPDTSLLEVLSSDATVRWVQANPVAASPSQAVAFDRAGNVLTASTGGDWSGTFFQKRDPAGTVVWSFMEKAIFNSVQTLATNSAGDALLASTCSLDGALHACITKVSSTGHLLWLKDIAGPPAGGYSQASGAAFDAHGHAVAAGGYSAGADFGHGPMATKGERDVFVVIYDK